MTIETFIKNAARRLSTIDQDRKSRIFRDLVAFRMGITPAMCLTHPEMNIPADVESVLWRDVNAINSGIPLGYVYGTLQFLDWEFLVDSRALCPRVETEELCDRVIKRANRSDGPEWILDLGCGSGVLGLSLAMKFPNSTAVLCDSEAPSLALARENCERFDLSGRVFFVRSDWWQGLEAWPGFDLIVSNPPYVADGDQVEPGVLAHEPHRALFAGKHGLDAIQAILSPLASRIRPGGLAAFELGENAASLLPPFLDQLGFPGEWVWETDLFGVRRYLFYVDGRKASCG